MNKPFTLVFGIVCLAIGLVMFTNPPRHFKDDAIYERTKTYNHRPVSSEVVSGTQLNLEEPANNQGIRIAGAIFVLFGGALLWGYFSDRKSANKSTP